MSIHNKITDIKIIHNGCDIIVNRSYITLYQYHFVLIDILKDRQGSYKGQSGLETIMWCWKDSPRRKTDNNDQDTNEKPVLTQFTIKEWEMVLRENKICMD